MTAYKTSLPDGVPRRTLFCKLTTFLTLVRQRWIWGFSSASLPSHQQISVLDMLNRDFAQMNPISTNHKVLVNPIQPCDIIWTLGGMFLGMVIIPCLFKQHIPKRQTLELSNRKDAPMVLGSHCNIEIPGNQANVAAGCCCTWRSAARLRLSNCHHSNCISVTVRWSRQSHTIIIWRITHIGKVGSGLWSRLPWGPWLGTWEFTFGGHRPSALWCRISNICSSTSALWASVSSVRSWGWTSRSFLSPFLWASQRICPCHLLSPLRWKQQVVAGWRLLLVDRLLHLQVQASCSMQLLHTHRHRQSNQIRCHLLGFLAPLLQCHRASQHMNHPPRIDSQLHPKILHDPPHHRGRLYRLLGNTIPSKKVCLCHNPCLSICQAVEDYHVLSRIVPSYWESISSQSFNHLVDQWSTINVCLLLAGLQGFSARSRLRSRGRWCRLGCMSCTRQIWKSNIFFCVFCSRLRCCGPNGIRSLTHLLQLLLIKTNPKESPELPIMKVRRISCIDVWSTLCLKWCRRMALLAETKAIDRHGARSVRSRTRKKTLTSACPGQGQTDSRPTTHSKFSWFPKLPGSNSQRVPWVTDVPPDAGRHPLRYQSELETGSLVPNFYHSSAVWLKGPKAKCQRGHVITWLYKIYIRQVKLTPCLKYFTCLRTAHRNCMQHNSAHQPSQEQQRYLLLVSLTTPTKKKTPGMTTCKPFYLTRTLLWISEISRVGNWRGTGGCPPKTKTNTQRGKIRDWRQT